MVEPMKCGNLRVMKGLLILASLLLAPQPTCARIVVTNPQRSRPIFSRQNNVGGQVEIPSQKAQTL